MPSNRPTLHLPPELPHETIAAYNLVFDFYWNQPHQPHATLLIGLSGGVDSVVLTKITADLHAIGLLPFASVQAVHVHHGLQQAADSWPQFCAQFCSTLSVPIHTHYTRVNPTDSEGLEGAARTARRSIFLQCAQSTGSHHLALANHQDDLLEGHLIAFARGAGLDGLAGFRPTSLLFDNSSHPVHLLRPFISIGKDEITQVARALNLKWVEDPTNSSDTIFRNAIRTQLFQVFDQHRPGWRTAARRSMTLLQESSDLVHNIVLSDFQTCTTPVGALDPLRVLALPSERQTQVVRHWLNENGAPQPPSMANLMALIKMLSSKPDMHPVWRGAGLEVRRIKGLFYAKENLTAKKSKSLTSSSSSPLATMSNSDSDSDSALQAQNPKDSSTCEQTLPSQLKTTSTFRTR